MTYEQWTNEKRKRRLLKRQEEEEAKQLKTIHHLS